jgi:hypothetical protein
VNHDLSRNAEIPFQIADPCSKHRISVGEGLCCRNGKTELYAAVFVDEGVRAELIERAGHCGVRNHRESAADIVQRVADRFAVGKARGQHSRHTAFVANDVATVA